MSTTPQKFDAIILGAGAAGLMCAGVAGQRGRRVALLEHNATPGRKILISGGGRANFTNIHTTAGNFLSENPHFAKSALALYTPRDFLALVESAGIRWHEKTLGQLFCNNSARELLDLLLAECERSGVQLYFNAKETRVEQSGSGFIVQSNVGEFHASALVVATGGLSIPKLGATGFGYDMARQFGLRIVEPRAALVPIVLGGEEAAWTKLAGLSAAVIASAAKKSFAEKMLFTHRGLSGPAILQASSYWRQGQPVGVNLLPGEAGSPFKELLESKTPRDERALRNALRVYLPQRLADFITYECKGFSNAALAEFAQRLHHWKFHPVGTEGFEKAEVTAGGVDTRDLEARTMESRSVSGLFFIGEVVDVTGHLGGFNFQWAWSSAVAAARAL
jgi:predicted Rossmann fold flavoprotein